MSNPPYVEPPHFPEDDLERYEAMAALAGLPLPDWLEQATREVQARYEDSPARAVADGDGPATGPSGAGGVGGDDEARLAAWAAELGLDGAAAAAAARLARRYHAARVADGRTEPG